MDASRSRTRSFMAPIVNPNELLGIVGNEDLDVTTIRDSFSRTPLKNRPHSRALRYACVVPHLGSSKATQQQRDADPLEGGETGGVCSGQVGFLERLALAEMRDDERTHYDTPLAHRVMQLSSPRASFRARALRLSRSTSPHSDSSVTPSPTPSRQRSTISKERVSAASPSPLRMSFSRVAIESANNQADGEQTSALRESMRQPTAEEPHSMTSRLVKAVKRRATTPFQGRAAGTRGRGASNR